MKLSLIQKFNFRSVFKKQKASFDNQRVSNITAWASLVYLFGFGLIVLMIYYYYLFFDSLNPEKIAEEKVKLLVQTTETVKVDKLKDLVEEWRIKNQKLSILLGTTTTPIVD